MPSPINVVNAAFLIFYSVVSFALPTQSNAVVNAPAQLTHKNGIPSTCPFEHDPQWRSHFVIDQLSVGQGDSAFLRTPNGTTVLIDGGDLGRGEFDVLPKLLKCYSGPGATTITIDYLVVSHPHSDHFGGLIGILQNQNTKLPAPLKVRRYVIVPQISPVGESAKWTLFKAALKHSNTQMIEAKLNDTQIIDKANDLSSVVKFLMVTSNGSVINLGPIKGVFDPKSKASLDSNANSISLLITYRNFIFFTSGDLSGGGKSTSSDLETPLSEFLPKVNVYKASHHGSDTSNNSTIMNKIQPQAIMVSVGVGGVNGDSKAENKAGFRLPDRTAVERMADISSRPSIFMTSGGETQDNPDADKPKPWPLADKMPNNVFDLQGDILISSDGEDFQVYGSKQNQTWRFKNIHRK